MKNHIVTISDNSKYFFNEISSIDEIYHESAYIVQGISKSITSFVIDLEIEKNFTPYGLFLQAVLRTTDNVYTAYFFKHGEKVFR